MTKLYALVTDQRTAAAETALCEDHFTTATDTRADFVRLGYGPDGGCSLQWRVSLPADFKEAAATVDEITARILKAYERPTRKRTKLEFCDKHAPMFLRESVYRRVETMCEGGWAHGGPCEGGRCKLYPGRDYICRETCEEYGLGEMPLDWTTE